MVLKLSDYQKIVVLTGAGVSVASGLGTYRGPGGLWEKEDLAKYTHVAMMHADPRGMWKAFGPLRQSACEAEPNAAHFALAALEKKLLTSQRFQLATQNVDGFHQMAGSSNVIELHGNLRFSRCSNRDCDLPRFEDEEAHLDELPLCERCGEFIRPDIVLFGEILPPRVIPRSEAALINCDLFISIGTSGMVMPAAKFVSVAKDEGARTIYLNVEPTQNADFDEEVIGPAEKTLLDLFV